jgi:hypothetical protein
LQEIANAFALLHQETMSDIVDALQNIADRGRDDDEE